MPDITTDSPVDLKACVEGGDGIFVIRGGDELPALE